MLHDKSFVIETRVCLRKGIKEGKCCQFQVSIQREDKIRNGICIKTLNMIQYNM